MVRDAFQAVASHVAIGAERFARCIPFRLDGSVIAAVLCDLGLARLGAPRGGPC